MSTQTPRRDNLHGEEDATPRFTGEHSSLGYDDATPAGKSSDPRGDDGTPKRNQVAPAGDPSDPRGDGLSRGDLGRKEGAAGDGSSTAMGDREKSLAGRANGGFYQQEDSPKRTRLRGRLGNFSRKRVAILATTGLIAGGGLLSFSILQGPLQLIHLSQILQKPSFNNEKVVKSRLNSLLRYNKTSDVGETRVGSVGSKLFRDATNDLRNAGIEFDRNPKTGHPRAMTIDISKHPEFKGMGENQARNAMAQKYGVSADQWTRTEAGKFALDTRDFGVKALLGISKTSLASLENGKIITGMQYRAIAKFFNTPIYGGIQRAAAEKDNKSATKAERREQEKERQKKLQPAKSEKFKVAKGKLNTSLQSNSGKLSIGLTVTEAVCLMRTVAEVVPTVNRGEVVEPTVAKSENIKSIGAHEQSGQGITLNDSGDVTQTLTDENGQSVWQGMALQALSGKSQLTGVDIDDIYRQAFSAATTTINIMGTIGNIPGANVVCSTPGRIIQGGVGIALLLTGPGGWAAKALQGGLGMAATSAALSMLQTNYTKLLADEAIVPDLLSGPQGGNLLAYGARESANISARSSGGVPLAPSEQLAYENEQRLEEETEFKSKGFLGRVFDVKDHRSLTAGLIQNSSTDMSVNASKLMSTFTDGGLVIGNLASTFTPSAMAANEEYQWDFPVYGIPQDLLTKYEDPYENAQYVTTNLLGSSERDTYIDRAKQCFGVSIAQDSEGWNVTPENDVNPNDADYAKGKCDDKSESWERMIVFVLDTRLVNIVDCWDGNASTCGEIGIESSDAPPADSARTLVDGSPEELAQKLLDHKEQGKYNCDNPIDCEDLNMTVKGESIKGGVGCTATKLDVRVLKLLVYLIEVKDYKIGTYALCRSHSLNNGAHPKGQAVDISSINGTSLMSSASKKDALAVDEIIFGLSGQLKARQIITGGVGNTRSVDADFVKFNRCGEGIEGQAAVDCFGSSTMAGHTEHIHVGY